MLGSYTAQKTPVVGANILVFLLSKEIVGAPRRLEPGPPPERGLLSPLSQLAIVHDHWPIPPELTPSPPPGRQLHLDGLLYGSTHYYCNGLERRPKRNVAYHRVRKSLPVDDWYAILTITIYSKITEILIIRWYFSSSNFIKIRFRHPIPIPLPLDAFSAFSVSISVPRFQVGRQHCEVRRAHQMVNPALVPLSGSLF